MSGVLRPGYIFVKRTFILHSFDKQTNMFAKLTKNKARTLLDGLPTKTEESVICEVCEVCLFLM